MCWSLSIICMVSSKALLEALDYQTLTPLFTVPEHFTDPCSINELGHYNVPSNPDEGYSMGMKEASKAEFVFPHGKYWSDPENMKIHGLA